VVDSSLKLLLTADGLRNELLRCHYGFIEYGDNY
jgi:hypothetical protein